MSQILPGYISPGNSKRWNLFSRSIAFKLDYVNRIKKLGIINPGDKVLELGCGQGHKLKIMRDAFRDSIMTGLEISPIMLQIANEQLIGTNITQGDMLKDKDIPSNIDVACYFQSLHHLSIHDRSKAGEIIYEKLNPNGRVVVIDTFDPNPFLNRIYAILSHYPGNKIDQFSHCIKSLYTPGKYNPENFGYYSPSKDNILGTNQSELFNLKHIVTPFFGKAISDILILEKNI